MLWSLIGGGWWRLVCSAWDLVFGELTRNLMLAMIVEVVIRTYTQSGESKLVQCGL